MIEKAVEESERMQHEQVRLYMPGQVMYIDCEEEDRLDD
jgi:hypothetical protein